MKVKELISKLQKMPENSDVMLFVFNDDGQEGNKEITEQNVFVNSDESGKVFVANREW